MSKAVILTPLRQTILHPDTPGSVITAAAGPPGARFTLYNFFYYSPVLKTVGSVLSTLLVQENLDIISFSHPDSEDLSFLPVGQPKPSLIFGFC